MPRIAFATCVNIPEPDVDQPLLLEACNTANLDAEMAPWDDPSIDWGSYDLVIPRSTWNYFEDAQSFRKWIRQVDQATQLWNPAALMLGNIHKSYLSDLAEEGVPVVPTRFFETGMPPNLSATIIEAGWERFVIKPAVSAASYKTRAFVVDELDEAAQFLADILSDRDAMVQEFMTSVANGGEVALVHVDGKLTHSIVKHPRFLGQEESVSPATDPDAAQKWLAKRVMDTVKGPWLYSRVDLMLDNNGRWVLSELEMIEPSLFLVQKPAALQRFVAALPPLCRRG